MGFIFTFIVKCLRLLINMYWELKVYVFYKLIILHLRIRLKYYKMKLVTLKLEFVRNNKTEYKLQWYFGITRWYYNTIQWYYNINHIVPVWHKYTTYTENHNYDFIRNKEKSNKHYKSKVFYFILQHWV